MPLTRVPSPYTYADPHAAAAIHFYFVKDKHPDDTLSIKPSQHSLRGFTAKYTQNSNATQVEHELANTELMQYLERLFSSMMFDAWCYESVQIDCPGYSSVVLKKTNVLSYLPILRSQIESLQNSWPLESVGKTSSNCTCSSSEKVNYFVTSTAGQRHVEVIPSTSATTQTPRVTRSSTRATGRRQ